MKQRVLIVEDEIIVADDLEWKLTSLGYETIGIAVSGEEALDLVKREQPDVVLMDIQLQGRINGIEAARQIQEETGAATIFVTAYPATLVRGPEQMQPPGVCVSKPFSTVQLKAALDAVVAALQKHKASAGSLGNPPVLQHPNGRPK